MRSLRLFVTLLVCIFAAVAVHAQKGRSDSRSDPRDPLTDAQHEQIVESGIFPNERVGLYTKFINQHADVIQGLIKRAEAGRDARMEGELEDLTELIDELASNLDTFGERKADIRASLTPLLESIHRWQQILQSIAPRSGFETSRDEAIDAIHDLATQTTDLIAEQKKYFEEHKDEAGQDRAEPK
jgi:archaellum component FlaC